MEDNEGEDKGEKTKDKEEVWKKWDDGVEWALWSVVELLGGIRTELRGVREEGRLLRHEFKETWKKLAEAVEGISDIGRDVLAFTDVWKEWAEVDEDEGDSDEGLKDVEMGNGVQDAE